ncbi:MAG: ComEC/Rec2 family competence protein [Candidatus Pacebacteria bacterium]|nr:ComEC/Rec2 family competence protein [Candidatus Paceibacterota bacterium]MDD3919254.1 ComEC/Rec2 family competence protein [Candidatus Paceibacterota bacterium]
MTHPQAFIYICLSFLLGIFLGSFYHSLFLIYFLLIILFSIIGILWKRKHVLMGVFLIMSFSVGFLYVNNSLSKVLDNEVTNYFNSQIETKGRVVKNPKDDLERKKAIVKIEDAKILVFTNEDLSYGDEVLVSGELIEPESFNNFDYKMYLANQGVSGIILDSKVEIIRKHYSILYDIKNRIEKIILENLSIRKAGILNATILGETDNMSFDLKQKLGFTGISHVVAISGQHIIILCMIMLSFLAYLRVGRKKAIIFTVLFLLFYIILIDFQASALRAFIMMCFVLFAELLGRQSDSLRSLVIAAVLILFFNPLSLVYDLGFQLSFLAVLGIIFFNNFFKEKLKFLKNSFLIDLVAVNFSAQVFVLPLLIYTFNYVSLASFITNILVVPISSVLLVLGFVCAFISLILPSLSFLLFAPISFILEYILFIVDKFSFMIISVNSFPIILIFIIYLVLGILAYKLRKERFEFYF